MFSIIPVLQFAHNTNSGRSRRERRMSDGVPVKLFCLCLLTEVHFFEFARLPRVPSVPCAIHSQLLHWKMPFSWQVSLFETSPLFCRCPHPLRAPALHTLRGCSRACPAPPAPAGLRLRCAWSLTYCKTQTPTCPTCKRPLRLSRSALWSLSLPPPCPPARRPAPALS